MGTELLLGQIPDTNSMCIAERLALAGVDCQYQTKVGDNVGRIAEVVASAVERNQAVIVCGGLGPTPDDVTREGIAAALDLPLERDPTMLDRIRRLFADRGRPMPESNARQADRPRRATFIPQTRGTAPGLVCPVGDGDGEGEAEGGGGGDGDGGKVVYALPGVPHEMEEMLERAVLPDLRRRSGASGAIVSRTLLTWGLGEAALAERLQPRFDAQDNPTIAFLASGIEGVKVRLTAKAATTDDAQGMLDAEEAEVRQLLGDVVFGVDQSMEQVVGEMLVERDLTLGVAESLTGGLVGARLAETPGASRWFKGSIVSYQSQVKFDLLGVPEGPVVSQEAADAMARGACRALGSDVGLGVTGVAGPARQEDQPPGTVFMSVVVDGEARGEEVHLPGDRPRVRQYATISLLDLLRRRLLARPSS